MRLMIAPPPTLAEASEFIARFHRHHEPPQGYKFAVGVCDDNMELHGVATVGRPVSHILSANRWTAEVTRLCTDGTPNACSMLYAAAWRTARAMGYRRIGTYILAREPGTSLLAAGWKQLYETTGKSWNSPSRPRKDKHELGKRTFWAMWDEDLPFAEEEKEKA